MSSLYAKNTRRVRGSVSLPGLSKNFQESFHRGTPLAYDLVALFCFPDGVAKWRLSLSLAAGCAPVPQSTSIAGSKDDAPFRPSQNAHGMRTCS